MGNVKLFKLCKVKLSTRIDIEKCITYKHVIM